jgi:hypothetical protein
MQKIVALLLLTIVVVFAANLVQGPKVSAVPIIGNYDPSLKPLPPPQATDVPILIYQVPDLRSTAGSPGKNIVFADDGQNVAVIYNRFSGDPDNFMQVYVAYSTDCGNSWIHYGPLSTFNARRTYPGVDAENNWPDVSDLRVHFAWHQAAQISGSYDSSPAFYAKEVMYPDGLITAAFRLPSSGTWDVWGQGMAVKDSVIVYTAANNGTFLTTYDCYIWRSTDYGETWDDGRVFFPGPLEWMWGPHMRFGSDGYIFFLFNRALESNPAIYWPYYCESFDYGVTWSQPELIWQDTPPYPDMSNVTGWWYTYDCAVVNDTPVAAMKLGSGNLDYGELWVYRPTGGSPGSWEFEGTRLVGGDSTAPQTYCRYAALAQDSRGDVFVGYQAVFETPIDTGYDCGMFVRPYNQNVWRDYGMITENFDDIEEKELEFAHNAPIINDEAIVAFIYTDAADYPTTGNLYFDTVAVETAWIDGIAEENHPVMNKVGVTVTPNPFSNSVKFALSSNPGTVTITIYDAAGKMIRELKNELVWDARNTDGTIVKSGVYFYSLSTKTKNAKGKIILSR